MKLNLGCGRKKLDGFNGVDISAKVEADIVHDLRQYPWPFEDESVDEILASHFIEHLNGIERMSFFNECWRIMKTGATMKCITPGAFTNRYYQDPTHAFPPVVAEFYLYLNKKQREDALLDHYPITCNFSFEARNELYPNSNIDFAEKHLINSVYDLHVTLTKLGDK
jgi:predicted SAM-dependent methyltransferase